MHSQNTIAVIGDIHGCINTLTSLYKKIENADGVYSVGDLIDRGKYSREVIDFCMENNIKSVKGNHEDMLMKAIDNSDKFFGFLFKDAELYYHNGGRETQNSYVNCREYSCFKNFKQKIKSLEHYNYIKSFPLMYEFEKVVISHAGIIDGGNDVSIIWNRKTPKHIDKLQIFGHTPFQNRVHRENYYTNIDTGCVYQNKLTAIIVDTKTGKVLEDFEEDCNPDDID